MQQESSPGVSESDGEQQYYDDQGQQQQYADAAAVPRPSTPSSDEHQSVVVTVEPIDKTIFLNWNEFHEYLAEYQQRTFQVYSTRTVTPVTTRNKRIKERYESHGKTAPPEELLPEEMGIYSKGVVCTHHGQPRPRAAGLRTRKPSRAINCPARMTLLLRKDHATGQYFVYVTSHFAQHNHELSGGLYRRHPLIRKVDDPDILRTVRALMKANVQPRKILEYVREHTDKEVVMRDVHNLLASLRKKPASSAPAPSTTVTTSVATSAGTTAAATPSIAVAVAASPGVRLTGGGATTPAVAAGTGEPPRAAVAPPRPPQPSVAVSADRPLSFVIRNAGQARPQHQAPAQPSPPVRREQPSQYGKFLAAFNVGKDIAELMAEMDDDLFAHCYAELRMFLRIIESGRIPVVTTREAMEHAQTNSAGVPSRPMPQQPAFRIASGPPSGASGGPNRPTTNSSAPPPQPFSSG